jgi:hypothetical protein
MTAHCTMQGTFMEAVPSAVGPSSMTAHCTVIMFSLNAYSNFWLVNAFFGCCTLP